MAIHRQECVVCAGLFNLDDQQQNPTCPFCKIPIEYVTESDDNIQNLLKRAVQHRQCREFERAKQLYHKVQGLAYANPKVLHGVLWGLALCEFGVSYVETEESSQIRRESCEGGIPDSADIASGLCRYPTCCLVPDDKTMANDYYQAACVAAEKAGDAKTVQCYQKDWDYISSVQSSVSSLFRNSDPWQIFICYKKSLPQSETVNGEQLDTIDTEYADNIYKTLTRKGYRVFFSDRTMKSMAGYDYEAVILHALLTARVMVIVCTDKAYLTTPWVQCEWQRYVWRMKHEASSELRLIPLITGFRFEELPNGLKMKEGFSLSETDLFYEMMKSHLEPFCQEQQIPSCQFCNTTLQTEANRYQAGEYLQCRTCGRYTYWPEEYLQALQEEASYFREARQFSDAARKYAALEQLSSNTIQFALGKLLSDLCIVFEKERSGRKPMLYRAPPQDALIMIKDIRRMLQSNNGINPDVKLCYIQLLDDLEGMIESYFAAEKSTYDRNQVVLMGPAPLEAHRQLVRILKSWGYNVFFTRQEIQRRSSVEAEGLMAHRSFNTKAMLVLCSEAVQLRENDCQNEWQRYLRCGEGMLIPIVMDAGASWEGMPEELGSAYQWQGEGDTANALFSVLSGLIPEVTVCCHERMRAEICKSDSSQTFSRCIQCGWEEPLERSAVGTAAARAMYDCLQFMQKGEYVKAHTSARQAARMAKEYAEREPNADKDAIQEQLYLMNFMSFGALTGLKIYRSHKGWHAAIGSSFRMEELEPTEEYRKDLLGLEKRKNILNRVLGDALGGIIDETFSLAEQLREKPPDAHRFDVCLTLRAPRDGGDEGVCEFGWLLADKLTEERLLIYNPLSGEAYSFWEGKELASHAAAFSSETMIVLTGSQEDTFSPEVRAQTERFRRGKPIYLALAENCTGNNGDSPNTIRIRNCDEANAEQLARRIRNKCVNLYRARLVELSRAPGKNFDEMMWYCMRGVELSDGKDSCWFQYRAGALCQLPNVVQEKGAQGIQMIQDAARKGGQEAIQFCRSKGLSF